MERRWHHTGCTGYKKNCLALTFREIISQNFKARNISSFVLTDRGFVDHGQIILAYASMSEECDLKLFKARAADIARDLPESDYISSLRPQTCLRYAREASYVIAFPALL